VDAGGCGQKTTLSKRITKQLERATNQPSTNRDIDAEQLCTSFNLIVQSVRSCMENQNNGMDLRKVQS
jgi:hypothetical protein